MIKMKKKKKIQMKLNQKIKKKRKIFVGYQKNYQNDKNLDLLNSENVYNEIAKRGKY